MMIRGPRPLPLHLNLAHSCWQSALCAWHASKLGWPIWSPAYQSNAAQFDALKNLPEFPAALIREIQRRMDEFQRGINLYHAHPFRRAAPPARTVWERGTTRLLDYSTHATGLPLLVIPSLVNRAYILDLLPEKSFMRYLAARGFRPLLVDWDAPGAAETNFGLTDYVTDRLLPMYDFVNSNYGASTLMGYCMGGNFALALAQLAPQKPHAIVLMATAWDFHAQGMPRFTEPMAEQLLSVVQTAGELSVDWLQGFFTALDPFGAAEKFMKFAQKDMNSDSARLFVALEDWLSDGVPLTAAAARDTMQDWYAFNAPMRGRWRVADQIINPAALYLPTLAVLPQTDRIVSPASAAALAAILPGALSLTPNLGHVGMMVSRDAQAMVWAPVAEWLNGIK